MKFCTIFPLLLVLGCSPESNPPVNSFAYRDFIEAHQTFLEALNEHDKGNYQKALLLFEKAQGDPVRISTEYLGYIVECNINLGRIEEASRIATLSFKYGYDFAYYSTFPELSIDSIQAKSNTEEYLQRTSILVKESLIEMHRLDQMCRSPNDQVCQDTVEARNIKTLHEIVDKYGYPGKAIQGRGRTYDASLIVIHSSEVENLNFLPIAIESARKGETSWFDPVTIMKNLLWRFGNPYNKIRLIKVQNGQIDFDESFFSLNVLSELLKDNPSERIKIHATNQGLEQGELHKVKNFLVRSGISESRIIISTVSIDIEDEEIFLVYNYL